MVMLIMVLPFFIIAILSIHVDIAAEGLICVMELLLVTVPQAHSNLRT